MADKNKGPNRAGNGSASDKGQAGKKPTPLLDLKATEVRGAAPAKRETTSDRAKFATGSSSSRTATAGSSQTSGQTSGSQTSGSSTSASTSHLKGAPDQKGRATATSTPPVGGGRSAATASAAGVGAGAAGAGAASGAGPSGAGGKEGPKAQAGGGGGSGGSGGRGPSPDKGPQSPPPAARKSGGGFFSTLTHLVAGVIGGGIALFAAEPLSQQFNLPIGQRSEVPAQLEQRLAALEQRPQASEGGVKPEEVAKLSDALEMARGRIAELGKLSDEVAALSKDVESLKAQPGGAAGAASGGEAGQGAAAGAADSGALRARLDKLENALSTLSSATSSNGAQSGIAPLAQFSSKIADLESSLNTQISELRTNLLKEVDGKVAETAEVSAKAVAGAQRLDREIAAVKTDTARLDQRAETLKAATDKLGETLRAVKEQAASIKVELDGLKGDVEQQFTKVARPADVEKAITPVSEKIASIEKDLGGVLANEDARKANAERIVLSLQLANLKRVLDRGQPYAQELGEVKQVAGDTIDFSALEAYSDKGVANARELTRRFQDVAYRIINADDANKDASVMDRLLAGAKSIVQVRRTDEATASAEGPEAAVARIENHLKQGNLTKALAEAKKLPETGQKAAKDWISELEARASVDGAIAKVEDQLKASLGGAKGERKDG